MSFVDQRLSQCVELGFSGGPMWNTLVVPVAGGAESRNAEWSMPHYKYTADYTILDPASQNEVAACFIALRGQRDSMRFQDPGDHTLYSEPMGTGDGTSAPRQIRKYYTFGSATFARDILLPVGAVVMANGSPISVTIDEETGLVTPSSVWPNGQVITVSGEFDVRVRFGSDFYPFTMPTKNISQVSVDLVEAITP